MNKIGIPGLSLLVSLAGLLIYFGAGAYTDMRTRSTAAECWKIRAEMGGRTNVNPAASLSGPTGRRSAGATDACCPIGGMYILDSNGLVHCTIHAD